MRQKKALIFMSLGLLLAFFSVTASGALSQVTMSRITDASAAAADNNGIIKLTNFNNNSYDLGTSYSTVGTITNNSQQALNVRVYAAPSIIQAKKTWALYVRVGTQVLQFSNLDSSGKWTNPVSVASGGTLVVRASQNPKDGCTAITSFSFEANNGTGDFSLLITDTANAPRRHNYQ